MAYMLAACMLGVLTVQTPWPPLHPAVAIGLIILCLNISAILFALGFVIVVLQAGGGQARALGWGECVALGEDQDLRACSLAGGRRARCACVPRQHPPSAHFQMLACAPAQVAVRIACTAVANLDVLGIAVEEVCVKVPSLQEEDICGYQALQVLLVPSMQFMPQLAFHAAAKVAAGGQRQGFASLFVLAWDGDTLRCRPGLAPAPQQLLCPCQAIPSGSVALKPAAVCPPPPQCSCATP